MARKITVLTIGMFLNTIVIIIICFMYGVQNKAIKEAAKDIVAMRGDAREIRAMTRRIPVHKDELLRLASVDSLKEYIRNYYRMQIRTHVVDEEIIMTLVDRINKVQLKHK